MIFFDEAVFSIDISDAQKESVERETLEHFMITINIFNKGMRSIWPF